MRNFLKITLVAVSLLTFSNIAHANWVLVSTVYSNGNYETHSQNPLGNTTGNHDCRTTNQFKADMAAKGWILNCN